jgi:hypothetical protein
MKLREFDKRDWMGYAGAESPYPGQEPLIGDIKLAGFPKYSGVVIVDGNGISIDVGDENDHDLIVITCAAPFALAKAFAEGMSDEVDVKHLMKKCGFQNANSNQAFLASIVEDMPERCPVCEDPTDHDHTWADEELNDSIRCCNCKTVLKRF